MGEEPEDYSKIIQEFYGHYSSKERDVLRKILTDEEERLWVDVEKKWIRKLKFFANVDAITQMMDLEDQKKNKKKEEGSGEENEKKKEPSTFYTFDDIPWLIHKYWDQPETYLKERLNYTRSAQSFMLNIYSAILITGGIGLWIICLTKFIEFLSGIGVFLANPLTHVFKVISFVISATIVVGGLVLLMKDKWRRRMPRTDEASQSLFINGRKLVEIAVVRTAPHTRGYSVLHPEEFRDPVLKAVLNIALSSYGSRQLLTMITQIFWSEPGDLIMIEEPEISLHPESQVLLQELFAEAIKEGKQIICTTHSPFLVLALSRVIRDHKISTDDVAVYHVEKTEQGTKVKLLELNERGFIKGWIPSYIKIEDELFREWAESLEK